MKETRIETLQRYLKMLNEIDNDPDYTVIVTDFDDFGYMQENIKGLIRKEKERKIMMKSKDLVIAEITDEYNTLTDKSAKLYDFIDNHDIDYDLKVILLAQFHAMRAYADSLLVRKQYLMQQDNKEK